MFVINEGSNASGNIKCLQPTDVINALQSEGLPSDIVEGANSLTIQHGPTPNIGKFLITQKDYQKLKQTPNWNYPVHRVTVYSDNLNNSVEYKCLTITSAINVLGKFVNENTQSLLENTVVMITLEDYRYWMARTYAYNFAQNFIATNQDFENGYIRPNTIFIGDNITRFWNLEETLTKLLDEFVKAANHGSFFAASYESDVDLSGLNFHNLGFPYHTILHAISRICEAAKLSFVVTPDGQIQFIGTSIADWPFTQIALVNSDDRGPSTSPKEIIAVAEKQNFHLYDDRCDINHPVNVHRYKYNVSNASTNSKETITVPYLMQSNYLGNNSDVNEDLLEICERYAQIRDTYSRFTYWKGYRNLHSSIAFGLDKVVYSNTGYGMITTAVGIELFNNFSLNYVNSPFVSYGPKPHGMWLYRFKLLTQEEVDFLIEDNVLDGSTTAGWGGGGLAFIYRHSGHNTMYIKSIQDPFKIFEDLGPGDWGWCIEVCEQYYAIQAACGGDSEDPATPPPPPPPATYECWDGSLVVSASDCPPEPFP